MLLMENLKNLCFTLFQTYYESQHQILDGTWHHVAVTWENKYGNLVIYVDGKVTLNNTVQAGSTVSSMGYLYLGHDQDSLDGGLKSEDAFTGLMTEFNLWNSSFTTEEVVALKNKCQSGQEGSVISWYRNILQSITGNIAVHRPSSCT